MAFDAFLKIDGIDGETQDKGMKGAIEIKSFSFGAENNINIGSIMRSLGGGGHPGAGSAMITSKSLSAVQELIKELIVGNQQSSVQISDLMSFPVITVFDHDTAWKVAGAIVLWMVCNQMDVRNTFCCQLMAQALRRQIAIHRLPARHCDSIIIKQLIGDIGT